MNTKIVYLYRDACNYKAWHEVVVQGEVDAADLFLCLKDGEFFIPSEVGLQDLQAPVFTEYDHIWHALHSVEFTDETENISITADCLRSAFRDAYENGWNESLVYRKRGFLKMYF